MGWGCQWSIFAFHKGALLFDGNAKEAFDKAKEANGGELKVKDSSVTWQLLEGDEEKEALKRIIEAQQETQKNKGRGKITISDTGSELHYINLNYLPCLCFPLNVFYKWNETDNLQKKSK